MKAEKFTILGGSGFIGSHLHSYLSEEGYDCYIPEKFSDDIFSRPLGHIIYCVGLTADFRTKPFETIDAHICFLKKVLSTSTFSSLLYLSSTRVYSRADKTTEDASLKVDVNNSGDLYDLSKLVGESLCLHSMENTRVVRLSNVYGDNINSPNFLSSVIKSALEDGRIVFETSQDSSKDYVSIDTVVHLLKEISLSGRKRIYNLANGRNTSHFSISEELKRLTGCDIQFKFDAPQQSFPLIDVSRLHQEFEVKESNVIKDLPRLLAEYINV